MNKIKRMSEASASGGNLLRRTPYEQSEFIWIYKMSYLTTFERLRREPLGEQEMGAERKA